ncbi:zinc finger and BTB domain-containing protein 5-like [Anopheles bellator]|uniref:zinc finger and BTB domain-containing protein 5-like n=1 Tax=Anopheles bellator TaxID=139047 RepID=UPI002648A7EB|nr:zinc finger and BTB domain-containing protein 5-like [Anopheles bellator]
MLTDPKLRTSHGQLSASPAANETAIKRELIEPSNSTTAANSLDDRLRFEAKSMPLGELGAEPGLGHGHGCGVRPGTLPYPGQTVQNKQPLQGFDQIWGPARADTRDRLQASVSGMSHYWPQPYEQPHPAATTASVDPAPAPHQGIGVDGHIYTLTVLHESPEHGIVWSDPTSALESPVPLAPDIVDPSVGYEPTVDCFNFSDATGYDLGDYYGAKPQQVQQQQQPPNGQPSAAATISLHGSVEGLLNEIQLTSFTDRSGPSGGDLGAQHSLYNEPSSYLYDNFTVPDSSSSSSHPHHHQQQQQQHHHQLQPMLPSLEPTAPAGMSASGGDSKLDTNNNSCPLGELNSLPPPTGSSSSSSRSSSSSSSSDSATGGAATGGANGQKRGRSLHYCTICSKAFKDKYSVNVHVRVHTGEKPFSCYLCGKSFRQKAHLEKHYQTHLHQKNLTKRPKPGAKGKQQELQRLQQPPQQHQQPLPLLPLDSIASGSGVG